MVQDHQTIEKILTIGSPEAYKVLVEKYQNSVFTFCFRILKNREEAEEVAQDTFIKCFKDLPKLKDRSKLLPWLMKIAYTRAIDRTRKKQLKTSEVTPAIENSFRELKTPYTETINQNRKEIIRRAIACLDEKEALIINLFYLEDLPVKEIVNITGMGMSNVKIKLFRARATLGKVIKKMVKEDLQDL